MKLELKNVEVGFGNWKTQKISFTAQSGEFFSIVGPTGSGKSTILKTIAGLISPEKGEVFLGEKNVSGVPAEKRNAGFAFQDSALFSHLSVFENIAFGLRIRKDKNVDKKVTGIVKELGLFGLEKRMPESLSGGQQRLVAIARALVIEPDIFLLDEPLNGLDARLREKIKAMIKKVQAQRKVTTVYVTHDIDEAFFLSDKVMVINDGKIEQVGSPQEIFLKPKTGFVKEFVSDYALAVAKTEGKKVKAEFETENGKGKSSGFLIVKKNNFREKRKDQNQFK